MTKDEWKRRFKCKFARLADLNPSNLRDGRIVQQAAEAAYIESKDELPEDAAEAEATEWERG